MTIADEAKSWFEGFQRIIGMSVDQMFGLLAPTALAAWYLSVCANPSRGGWPSSPPFQWFASASEAAGINETWALNIHLWIGDRGELFAPYLIAAGLLTGHANRQDRPTAFLGLATIAYAAALELHNSPTTLLLYLASSIAFCLVAILIDKNGSSYWSGYINHPRGSFIDWFTSVAVVAFSWITLPFMILAGAVQGYRIEDRSERAVATGATSTSDGSATEPGSWSDIADEVERLHAQRFRKAIQSSEGKIDYP